MLLIQSSWNFFSPPLFFPYVWWWLLFPSFSFASFFSISRLPWLNWTARTIIDDFNFFSSSLPLLFVLLHVAAACVCVWLMRELNFSFLKISTFSCTRIVVDDERQKEENFVASTWTKKSNYFSYFLLVLSQANNMKSHWNIIAGNSPVDERQSVEETKKLFISIRDEWKLDVVSCTGTHSPFSLSHCKSRN